MYNNSANEMLMGGGIPSLKFESIGTAFSGTIAMQPEVLQQRDFTTGEPKFYDDGKPMQQIKLVLDTDQRDPDDPYDEGQRTLWVKGNLFKEMRTAVRAARAKGLEVGGKIKVAYVGDGEPPKRGMNPPKLFKVVYEAPGAPALDLDSMAAAPAAPPAPAVPAPAPASAAPTQDPWATPPAPAPAPAAQPSGRTAEQEAALAQLTPAQRHALGLPG